jgi:hypothetical protein
MTRNPYSGAERDVEVPEVTVGRQGAYAVLEAENRKLLGRIEVFKKREAQVTRLIAEMERSKQPFARQAAMRLRAIFFVGEQS